ncbi:DUF3489 domain-containing protein [Pseudorhodoplanes sp.]|uniref:DUF3489 domain-containing protein n=1 Tax=Pseudorhodoplanes sp. TaxID=1934341 RepID=UPI003D14BA07
MPKSSRKLSSQRKIRRAASPKRSRSSRSIKPTGKPTPGPEQFGASKQDKVIALLTSEPGTTVPAIMEKTGWQQHSVHGFLSGVVRKKLKLRLVSEKIDGQRIYRIDRSDVAKPSQSKHAAS